jgi:transposase
LRFYPLGAVDFDQPLLREVFDCYFTEMRHCLQRVKTLDRELEKLAQSEAYREVAGILRCFYGIKTLTAMTIITEIFDFGRFASVRDFMSYLGLTPSEFSSGEKQQKGSITKTGNKRARRLLEINISRIVPMLTSATLAKKISNGKINHAKKPEFKRIISSI